MRGQRRSPVDGECGRRRSRRLAVNRDGEDEQAVNWLNDVLPTETLEEILQYVRPSDLVSVADSFPRLKSVVQRRPFWNERTVKICGNDVNMQIRQLQLAPELKELQVGLGVLSKKGEALVRDYDGPVPLIHSLRLQLSGYREEFVPLVLEKFGKSVEHLELDLRRGLHEKPCSNVALIQNLRSFPKLRRLTIRTNDIKDIIAFEDGIPPWRKKIVEVDIHRVPIEGDAQTGMIIKNFLWWRTHHIKVLRLPPSFDAHVISGAAHCLEVTTLACNVWTIPAVDTLTRLQSLYVFCPDRSLAHNAVMQLVAYAQTSRRSFYKIRDLRLVNSDVPNLKTQLASEEVRLAVLGILLYSCRMIQVLVLEWPLPKCNVVHWNWMSTLIESRPLHLRELRLGRNLPASQYVLMLPGEFPNLEILDLRRFVEDWQYGKHRTVLTTTSDVDGMKRALELVLSALPRLTILFDDNAENSYDWNFYRNCWAGRNDEGYVRVCYYIEDYFFRPSWSTNDKLFSHMSTFETWVSASRGFGVHTPVDLEFWQCATLDSSFWNTQSFCQVLRKAPALGLVDCRSRKCLTPAKNDYWMRSLAVGPTCIRALRIQARLVAPNLWHMVDKVLVRVGGSLENLELDFRGSRTFRDWGPVLSALRETPRIAEFALRGTFDDDKPVLDWLHGRLHSLRRLDLRDCQMAKPDQAAAFVVSFEKLLAPMRQSLSSLALPPLPKHEATTRVLRMIAQMTHLRDIALHVNELWIIRSFKNLVILTVYSDKKPSHNDTKPLAMRLMWYMRQLSDVFRNIGWFTLPWDLHESEIVQDAISDLMPKLCRLHIIERDGEVKTCVEGPRCTQRSVWYSGS